MSIELTRDAIVAGRYRLDRLLGSGGMGSVWAATTLDTGATVALKFVSNVGSAEHRLRFLREARAAAAVVHPNVRQVYDVFDLDDGSLVMSMEYLAGEPLSRTLVREGTLALGDFLPMMLQVVSAVGAAHAAGVVHRDLKPENVFVCEGRERRIKILDFGVAKLARAEPVPFDDESTATGSLVGTPSYMSPEQLFAERDLDHRSDIWSLGLIFYRGLTGVLPTEAQNVGQALKRILDGDIPPIRELAPELPEDLAELTTRMLARLPHDRPRDLREVWDVLSRYLPASAPTFGPALTAERGGRERPVDSSPVTHDPTRRAFEPARHGSQHRSDPPRR